MGIGDIISLILAGLSLFVSAAAFCVSWRNQKRILDIEESRDRDRRIAGKRAHLKAYIEEKERKVSGSIAIHRTHYLVVENDGSGEASNVNLQIKGKPVSECTFIIVKAPEVKQVGPRSSFSYELKGFAQHLPLDVRISWEDDSGEGGSYSTMLTGQI
jgi:hypothetical protein